MALINIIEEDFSHSALQSIWKVFWAQSVGSKLIIQFHFLMQDCPPQTIVKIGMKSQSKGIDVTLSYL